MEYDFFSKDFFTYTVVDGKARLCFYRGSEKILTIPRTLGGYPVTSIGQYFLLRCKTLVEVVIPNSVTSIGDSAFYACKNLQRVEIPDSVTCIGESAFGKCFGLVEIKISDNNPVYRFFEGALFDKVSRTLLFYFGGKGLPSYIVPDFVATIAHNAFMDCITLKEVFISDGVSSIEKMAFYGCKRLKSVSLGKSVVSIGRGAFYECGKLKKVLLPKSAVDIEDKAFGERVVVVVHN